MEINATQYPALARYAGPLTPPARVIVGREREITQVLSGLARPEVSNVVLLAEPGTGKTALVQAVAQKDTGRDYLEVSLSTMIAGTSADQMAPAIKELFDDAERYAATVREVVLFIDEFHQIVQLSPAAVEALKPALAASGQRGLRVIAATTFEEFHTHVRPNQALVERLQRINLSPPDTATTVKILEAMALKHGVGSQFYDTSMFETIVELTERYMPSSVQPRKSILVLDSMIGWHKVTGRPMDMRLLADVIEESAGVKVAFKVDANAIKSRLDEAVFAQELATTTIAKRLQLCVADLYDHSRPISSFLFAGSTGVGKSEMAKSLAKILYGDDTGHLVRIDCSEFSQPESVETFRHELTRAVWSRGHCVVMLDEIEKAHRFVHRLLLAVLDEGRLSDENGRQVSFLNTYIVLTTNAGSEIFRTVAEYSPSDDGSGDVLKERMREIRRAIAQTFPVELLGRIDAIVPFQPLSYATRERIVKRALKSLRAEVRRKHGVALEIGDAVLRYLIEDKGNLDSDAGGARASLALLADEVTSAVAAYINTYPAERSIIARIDGALVSDNKTLLRSDARVVVAPAPGRTTRVPAR